NGKCFGIRDGFSKAHVYIDKIGFNRGATAYCKGPFFCSETKARTVYLSIDAHVDRIGTRKKQVFKISVAVNVRKRHLVVCTVKAESEQLNFVSGTLVNGLRRV